MKKNALLNSQLSAVIASMGHTDELVICDAGLPVPRNHQKIDLALTANIPRFLDTLRVVMEELEVEKVIVAEEMETVSPDLYQEVVKMLNDIPLIRISHESFKDHCRNQRDIAFVRTGEMTPYANIILISGVTFG